VKLDQKLTNFFNASDENIAFNTINSMQYGPCKADCRQAGEEITCIS